MRDSDYPLNAYLFPEHVRNRKAGVVGASPKSTDGESIIIDDDIKVTVVSVSAGAGRPYVTLGITAPAKYKIFREEIYEEIKRENQAASCATVKDLSALSKTWLKEKELPPDQ